MPPLVTELLHDLAEWRRAEVQVPLNRQAQWPPNRLQFREHEVAPFFFEADNVSKEAEVSLVFLILRSRTRSSWSLG